MDLIERDHFLQLLEREFEHVAAGEGRCVLVTGEAGLGKTSLIKTFLKKQTNNSRIYVGACDGLFTPRPLAPLYDILWQVNPARWPETPKPEERATLFSDFFREIHAMGDRVIIVFEDIHWADEATLDFIKFFARRIEQICCLFILSYRSEEIYSALPLRKVLGQLPHDACTRIFLAPLSRASVERLAAEKGYNGEEVYSVSGGNPFYVNEILASYSPGVPENIKDSILSVYERLEHGTRQAWQVCSVIPEGLEIDRFTRVKASSGEAMDHCFALGIINVRNGRVVFKHELYRRTIEESLPPFRRIELNRLMLDLFLESFEEKKEIERIIHYAKNANEKDIVLKYAPLAARHAMQRAAHLEAARLLLTAIEYADQSHKEQLVELYEAYAHECYLINQVNAAIIYQTKALAIREGMREAAVTADCCRKLSIMCRADGRSEEAAAFAQRALEAFVAAPSTVLKGLALANMAHLRHSMGKSAEGIQWATQALNIGRELTANDVVCDALNALAAAQTSMDPHSATAIRSFEESISIARKHELVEHAAAAFHGLAAAHLNRGALRLTADLLPTAIGYTEEMGHEMAGNKLLLLRARLFLARGDWSDALAVTRTLLQHRAQLATVRIDCGIISALVQLRQSGTLARSVLAEIRKAAFGTKQYELILRAVIASLESEWICSEEVLTEEEIVMAERMAAEGAQPMLNSEFALWLQRARKRDCSVPAEIEPYRLMQQGNGRMAAGWWQKAGSPYESALALTEGDEEDQMQALTILQQIGAEATASKVKWMMRASGIRKIPRGVRASTKSNPAQLTNRELDVLQLMRTSVHNKEIAGSLFISTKTVDNHISSIFFKLDVNSRAKAVEEALRLGILK